LGLDGFPEFLRVLRRLAFTKMCAGCRAGGGDPDCPIRKCARGGGVDFCHECREHPCEDLRKLSRRYVTLLGDNERHRAIGTGEWVIEQEERRQRGFFYADLKPLSRGLDRPDERRREPQ